MNRLRLLFGVVAVLLALLVPAGSAAASGARVGPVAPAPGLELMTGFYCPAATASGGSPCMPCRPDAGSASCPMSYKAVPTAGLVYLQITNHANLGEYCRVALAAGGYLGGNWIDAGDNSISHLVGNMVTDDRYQVRCQRRAASGDAGIGGYLWRQY